MKGNITITIDENGSIVENVDIEHIGKKTCFALIQSLAEIITDISGAMSGYDNDSENTSIEVS